MDLFDCDHALLNDHALIQKHMVAAAKAAKATVVNALFHKFNPYGVSGVVVIAESHLAIHTWPEYGFAAVDVFTCGPEVDPRICQKYLTKALKAKRSEYHEFERGVLKVEGMTHKPMVGTRPVKAKRPALGTVSAGHQKLQPPAKLLAAHRYTRERRPSKA